MDDGAGQPSKLRQPVRPPAGDPAAGRVAIGQLVAAVHTRDLIDMATEILVIRQGCGPEDARSMLARASLRSGRTLRAIAVDVVAGERRVHEARRRLLHRSSGWDEP